MPQASRTHETDSQPEAKSWGDLLSEARRLLSGSGASETPEVDARRIVEAASGASPADFERVLGARATTLTAARFFSMLERRCAGEPLQYVVGSWGFRSLDLMVDRRVLIPRPETEVVAGWAVDEVQRLSDGAGRDHQMTVVDLGTGSGAIGLSVAVECPQARVFATDVSADALAVARANLAGLGRAAARVSLHEGDWFDALPAALRGAVDVVVSNPPYIGTGEELPPVIADWEPPVALWSGPAGHEAVEQVIGGASQWLRPGGSLVMEAASHRAQQTAHMVAETGFADVRVEHDLAGLERVVIGRLP
ncbi:MAG: peptide chain release factor N(5)-glutamine methyltransferase [Acidimicrobiaceae bacterium]|nr:peptide chain release factor N(5)-glutamine methyltransferase [Acidimicrobiaceae bacterium]MDE0494161.1 peptide chain release factor N(5)-glutamine methyltransferase [Acidimicrobiaceae bacterium]MYA13233.1 peptide chain release factor N(5)-glutamine methyltransferase [Acidimicrobiaceae bacterium]MYE64525.1 peptide chain release factor N(5)-glutamine methyltransferase [Acidimicrobiaceae bacterium]